MTNEQYFTSITCTTCGVQDLRCVNGVCRNCAWNADCQRASIDEGLAKEDSPTPMPLEALCTYHVNAIESIAEARYVTDGTFADTCVVCGYGPHNGIPTRLYAVSDTARFVPVVTPEDDHDEEDSYEAEDGYGYKGEYDE